VEFVGSRARGRGWRAGGGGGCGVAHSRVAWRVGRVEARGFGEIAIWAPSRRRVGLRRWDRIGMSTADQKLQDAARKGNVAGIEAALRGAANVNAIGKYGWTPLHWALEKGHLDVVNTLLAGGAAVNQADKDGRAPLWWASHQGHVGVVDMLLNAGADPSLADNDGKCPIDVVGSRRRMKAPNKAHAPAITAMLLREAAWRRRVTVVLHWADVTASMPSVTPESDPPRMSHESGDGDGGGTAGRNRGHEDAESAAGAGAAGDAHAAASAPSPKRART